MADRIDQKLKEICDKLDLARDKIIAAREYNRNTAFLVMVLWGLGLPMVFLAAIIIAARS